MIDQRLTLRVIAAGVLIVALLGVPARLFLAAAPFLPEAMPPTTIRATTVTTTTVPVCSYYTVNSQRWQTSYGWAGMIGQRDLVNALKACMPAGATYTENPAVTLPNQQIDETTFDVQISVAQIETLAQALHGAAWLPTAADTYGPATRSAGDFQTWYLPKNDTSCRGLTQTRPAGFSCGAVAINMFLPPCQYYAIHSQRWHASYGWVGLIAPLTIVDALKTCLPANATYVENQRVPDPNQQVDATTFDVQISEAETITIAQKLHGSAWHPNPATETYSAATASEGDIRTWYLMVDDTGCANLLSSKPAGVSCGAGALNMFLK